MIYPTQRAVLLMGLGIPLTLIVSFMRPELWAIGAAWIALVLALMLLDVMFSPAVSRAKVDIDAPGVSYIGNEDVIDIHVRFDGGATPAKLECRPELNQQLSLNVDRQRLGWHEDTQALSGRYSFKGLRRGEGKVKAIWLRWSGFFGLIWKQRTHAADLEIPVIADTKSVQSQALSYFNRDAMFGQKIQIDRGEGTEFDSLREFTAGMDHRAIDWKHSAKHRSLLAKEFRTERNHNIMFAFDSGRLMCEPLQGVTRLDRGINAALLMSYVCLKNGDRVGFYSFDSQPRLMAKPISNLSAFGQIKKQTAKITYSLEETNFTLGLTQLSRTLNRRSLIVIFTDFVDTTNAELMIENVSRLIKKHLVVFVVFKDDVLASYMNKTPQSPEDISKAVIAASLAKDQDIVISKLQRMGVQIVESDIDHIGPALLNSYFDLKQRGKL